MISQVSGKVASKGATFVVVDCGGVGYSVSVPLSTLDLVAGVGENVTLLTIMVVREDSMQLFGFLQESERDAFRLLTSIQGIGGRIALGILSATTMDGLRSAVATGNIAALTRLPGIGKKTAERLVVELREKILAIAPTDGAPADVLSIAAEDAVNALQALGYSKASADKAVKKAMSENSSTSWSSEELIRTALRLTR